MSFFKKDISELAATLKHQAEIFNCSYETAWKQWMHPVLTEQASFEDVMNYIQKNK